MFSKVPEFDVAVVDRVVFDYVKDEVTWIPYVPKDHEPQDKYLPFCYPNVTVSFADGFSCAS